MLCRLLDSIPKRRDVQIIVVDDFSSEEEKSKAKEVVEEFGAEFYTNSGRYAGGARNTGITHAKGCWLLFADADDYYESSLCSQLDKYETSEADIVFFPVTSRYSDTGEPAYRGNHVNLMHEKFRTTGNDDYLRCCHLAPWSKMIKRSLVEKYSITYEECIAGNDNWFSVNTGVLADTVEISEVPIYCITVSSGSLTTTLNKERFEAKFQSSMRTNRFLRKYSKNKYQISILYFLAGAHQFGFRYILHVIISCVRMGANPFIGMSKLLHPRKALNNRQNKKVVKDERREGTNN